MGSFEAFYYSALQHPWLLWAAAIAGFGFAMTRPSLDASARRYVGVLLGLSLADAWLTSTHVYGIGTLPEGLPAPLFFVLAGDFRFLLLFGAARRDGGIRPSGRSVLTALGLTLVVPVVSQGLLLALGNDSSRVLFFVYELCFVFLTLGLLRWHPAVIEVTWLRSVCRFVLLYYGLWASADAILLATGADLGFGLRVVPNVLYYGGLLGAIGWASARASAQSN